MSLQLLREVIAGFARGNRLYKWNRFVFIFFLFFSSPFIERIGAHGKQNPDFIIYFYYLAKRGSDGLTFCNCYRIVVNNFLLSECIAVQFSYILNR